MTNRTDRLERNLAAQIKQFLAGKGYRPMRAGELMAALAVVPQYKSRFRDLLQDLVRQGEIENRRGRYALPTQKEVISGLISVHPRGFGFVKPEDGEEVFIPKHLTHHAVDGDQVEVAIDSVSEKGPEGRVLAILKRARTHIAGTITKLLGDRSAYAYVPILGPGFQVLIKPHPEIRLDVGDRVVMHVLEWGSRQVDTIAEVIHYLGSIDDPSTDIEAGCEEYELRLDFPSQVVSEAKGHGSRVFPRDMKGREDFRDIETVTIDPKTAKDFDDALSISIDKKGNFHLAVHIADVSHYVHQGSALDQEAALRCNSTYLPGFCVPMLPPELSDHLCSLRPKVNRLAVSVLMRFDKKGNLEEYDIVRSVIRSDKRFTYEEAMEVLDGKRESPHKEALEAMVKLCGVLKKHRHDRGGVEFALPEAVLKLDEMGMPTGVEWVDYDITHQLVEEFMLKANEVVARHIDEELERELPYRIHEEPSKESMRDFATMVRTFGHKISEEPTADELRDLFTALEGTPEAKQVAVAYIRSMQMAIYSPVNVGHYGLKLEHYCHFTSPIRRYVDLVIHRTLFEEAPSDEELREIAERCSEQERKSSRAETQVRLLKRLRLLKKLDDEEPYRQFEGVVASVKPFGLFFEVVDLMVEGFIHISQLGGDYFRFDERRMQLIGDRSGQRFAIGDSVTVMVKRINLITLESDWELVSDRPSRDDRRERKRRGKKKRRR